jgi:hypothetical protein
MIYICDIDDVIRNLKDRICSDMNLFHRTKDWGEYYYHNPKIREYFDWYSEQDFYHNLFVYSPYNNDITEVIFEQHKNHGNVIFLSANKDKKSQDVTRDWIRKIFINFIYEHNNNLDRYNQHLILSCDMLPDVIYVDSWKDKVKYVLDNYYDKLNQIIMIDDRPDTCLSFTENGMKSVWYTKYVDDAAQKLWIERNSEFVTLQKTDNFYKWYYAFR